MRAVNSRLAMRRYSFVHTSLELEDIHNGACGFQESDDFAVKYYQDRSCWWRRQLP